jgi:hypothetical protein
LHSDCRNTILQSLAATILQDVYPVMFSHG